MQKNNLLNALSLTFLAFAIIILGSTNVSAQNTRQNVRVENKTPNRGNVVRNENRYEARMEKNVNRPVSGVITAINGNILTISSTEIMRNFLNASSSTSSPVVATTSTTTLYTVNASSAKVFKDGATGSVASLLVGDKVMINGVVNGNTIEAKIIHSGNGQLNSNRDGQKIFQKPIFEKVELNKARLNIDPAQYQDLIEKIKTLIKNTFNLK